MSIRSLLKAPPDPWEEACKSLLETLSLRAPPSSKEGALELCQVFLDAGCRPTLLARTLEHIEGAIPPVTGKFCLDAHTQAWKIQRKAAEMVYGVSVESRLIFATGHGSWDTTLAFFHDQEVVRAGFEPTPGTGNQLESRYVSGTTVEPPGLQPQAPLAPTALDAISSWRSAHEEKPMTLLAVEQAFETLSQSCANHGRVSHVVNASRAALSQRGMGCDGLSHHSHLLREVGKQRWRHERFLELRLKPENDQPHRTLILSGTNALHGLSYSTGSRHVSPGAACSSSSTSWLPLTPSVLSEHQELVERLASSIHQHLLDQSLSGPAKQVRKHRM